MSTAIWRSNNAEYLRKWKKAHPEATARHRKKNKLYARRKRQDGLAVPTGTWLKVWAKYKTQLGGA